ncbi:MAG: ribonuclease J [Alphaproteobacteria bacterium]|nr:ribonuclease J [Alphaproteobacteria bacterium]
MKSAGELLFLPLGGSGEIGMNLNLYQYDGKWLMVDLGITFADATLPGVEVLMPDPTYIVERRDQLLGIVLTHAHEDHLGAVQYLWPLLECPVYATPFSAAILRAKLNGSPFADRVPIVEVPLGGRLKLGPFDITFMSITHSIPEGNALAIRTPAGNILHTGDWKLDPDPQLGAPTNPDEFIAFGRAGVLALVCDSTNVFQPGRSGSEGEVFESLRELVDGRSGRIAITSFASHLARIRTLARIARLFGREPVLVGRSLWRTVAAGREAGYLDDFPNFVGDAEGAYLAPDKVLLICTGCQGEPRAAMARIASENHPNIVLETGDTAIFSSKVIPGNERSIAVVQNRLVEKGVEVIGESDHFVHVSGHPARDELADMYGWIRPRIAIPVHGEARHLAEHVLLAKSFQTPEALAPQNGTVIRLAPGPATIVDRVKVGRLALDGDRLIPTESEIIRDRRRMASSGHIVATIVLTERDELAATPRIATAGITNGADSSGSNAEATLGLALGEDILRMPGSVRRDDHRLEEAVRRTLRTHVKNHTSKKPAMRIEIVRLGEQTAQGSAGSKAKRP